MPQNPPPPPQPQSQPQQPVQSAPPVNSQPQNEEPVHVELTVELVNSMLELDNQVALLESRNVLKQCSMKQDQLQRLDAQMKAMVAEQQQLAERTRKEYQDVVDLQNNTSVRQMWSQQQFDQQMGKEQQEYMDALNQQEIHKKKIMSLTQQQTLIKNEVTNLQGDRDNLQSLYDKQDSILSSIFDGKYGSEAEYRLETELDMLMERKQRVAVARYKWNNSHTLVKHACGQLSFGIRRWGDVLQLPVENSSIRYQFAAEARNNFVAASQNITTAQRYLNTITFPYCTHDEMATLNKAIANIFTDMMSNERHKHAMECYVTVYRRSAALVQWFEHVINKTINKDLEGVTKNLAGKQRDLKMERMKLVHKKVRDQLGDEVANKMEAQVQNTDSELTEDKEEPELAMLVDADRVSQAGELTVEQNNGIQAPTPLGVEELAPTPAMDDIFGNIEELKRKHDEQVKEYERQQEVAKTRADQDLQSKLAARRSRRQRQAAQEAEMAALQDSSPY
ncbi:uncharacterized protein [Diadema antillarum]|uniref:uncharacterized protein n=1 Tax=Diadema antillarum TaxID=105358 RepID=UPI003A8528BB